MGGIPQNFRHCETKLYSLHTIFGTMIQNSNSSHKDFDSVRQNCDPPNKILKIFGTLENFKFQNGVFAKLILEVVVILYSLFIMAYRSLL